MIAFELNRDPAYDVTVSGNRLTISNCTAGDVADASAGDSGFTVETATQGASTPHNVSFDSNNTAQVAIDDAVGGPVTLTAPWSAGGQNFVRWRYEGGELITPQNSASITVDADATVVAVYGSVIYVDAVSGSDSHSGRGGWGNAVQTLQHALDLEAAAADPNDEIWVRAGTYLPTQVNPATPAVSASKSFRLPVGASIYGGFDGTESDRGQRVFHTVDGRALPLNQSILSGDTNAAIAGGEVYHVVTGANDVILDGFTITQGNANGSAFPHNRGAGFMSAAGSPRIENCLFIWNHASKYGGALYCLVASPTVVNCVFGQSSTSAFNSAIERGGAVYCESGSSPKFIDCSFFGNRTGASPDPQADNTTATSQRFGGAVFNNGGAPEFSNCLFQSNAFYGYGNGGAISNAATDANGHTPRIENCIFYGNRAMAHITRSTANNDTGNIASMEFGLGGAIYNDASSPFVKNCVFGGASGFMPNTSTRYGGAIYNGNGSNPTFNACRFDRNRALLRGGSVYGQGLATAGLFTQCTFTGNKAAFGGAVYSEGAAGTFSSCVFDGNVVEENQILDFQYSASSTPSSPALASAGFSFYSGGDYFAGWSGLTAVPFTIMPPLPDPFPFAIPENTTLPSIVGTFGGFGGAVYNDDASATFVQCSFRNHKADKGGAVYFGRARLSLDPGETVETEGQGDGNSATLTNCVFQANRAVEWGGALYHSADYQITVTGCQFGDPNGTDAALANSAGPQGAEEDPSQTPERDFYVLNAPSAWATLPGLPAGRRGGRLVHDSDNNNIYYIGGIDRSGTVRAQVWILDLDDVDRGWWPLMNAGSPSLMSTARYEFGATYYNGYVYVFGGYTDPTTSSHDPIAGAERMDVGTGQWSAIAAMSADRAEQGAAVVVTRNGDETETYARIHLVGGYSSGNGQNACETYWITAGPGGEAAGSYTSDLPNVPGTQNAGRTWLTAVGSELHAVMGDQGPTRALSLTDNRPAAPVSAWTTVPGTDLPARGERFTGGYAGSQPFFIGGRIGTADELRDVHSYDAGAEAPGWQERSDYPGIAWREMASVSAGSSIYVGGGVGRDKDGYGGAIYSGGGTLIVHSTIFDHNQGAPQVGLLGHGKGGAIYCSGTELIVDKSSSFTNNSVANRDFNSLSLGGAICHENASAAGSISISNSTLSFNQTASNYTDSTAGAPTSSAHGGAVYANNVNAVDIDGCAFSHNSIGVSTVNASGNGAGLYVSANAATFSNSTFNNNRTGSGDGGAVWAGLGLGDVTVDTCTFLSNSCSGPAGGLCVEGTTGSATVYDSNFSFNSGSPGGAFAGRVSGNMYTNTNASLFDCDFSQNSTSTVGGALVGATLIDCRLTGNFAANCGAAWNVTMTRCLVDSNSATSNGGGIADGDLYECVISNNVAGGSGGGIHTGISATTYTTILVNTVIWNNSAGQNGGAVYGRSVDYPVFLHNSTLTANTANAGGGVAFFDQCPLTVRNSIIWGNTAAFGGDDEFAAIHELITDDSDADILYTCIRGRQAGGIANGEGNIGSLSGDNPLFIDAPNGNLRLSPSSPCINAGTSDPALNANVPMIDIDGNPRQSIDMGAYESLGNRPEMRVSGRGAEIVDGDTTPDAANNTLFAFLNPTLHNNGEIQAVTSARLTLDPAALASGGAYAGMYIRITSGAAAGKAAQITLYLANREAVVGPLPWLAQVAVGDTYQLYAGHAFEVENLGIQDLLLVGDPAVTISGADADDFAVLQAPLSLIGSGQTSTLIIGYYPTLGGAAERVASITIASNDADENPYDFSVQGQTLDPSPEIAVTGKDLNEIPNGSSTTSAEDGTDFGDVNFRSGTVVAAFAIANNGGGPLALTGSPIVQLDGDSDFTVSAQPSATGVGAGQSLSFEITFDPQTVGPRSAIVSIANDDADEAPYTFAIVGRGVGPRIIVQGNGQDLINVEIAPDDANTPSIANYTDFGDTAAVADGLVERSFVLANTGTQPLNLEARPAIEILKVDGDWNLLEGQFSDDFQVVDEPATDIPEGLSTSFTIRYTPRDGSTTTHDAVIRIPNNDRSFSFRITGTNSVTNIPPVAVTSSSVNGVATNQAPIGALVLLNGSGSYDVDGEIISYQWTETPSHANPSPLTINNANDMIANVDLTGAVSGVYKWRLTVTDNGEDGAGTNAATDVEDLTVYVGDVMFLTMPATVAEDAGTLDVLLTFANAASTPNDLGTRLAKATLPAGQTRLGVGGTSTAGFVGSVHLRLTLNDNDVKDGNQDITIQISDTLGAYAMAEGVITVVDDDVPAVRVLGGGIVIADGDTTPSSVDYTDFGPVYRAAESATRIYTVQNIGGDDLTISNVAISGPDAGDFSVVSSTSLILPPGGSSSVEVAFNPATEAIGVRQATVTISSDDPDADDSEYSFAIMGSRASAPEITVEYNSIMIVNNDSTPSGAEGTDFGSTSTDQPEQVHFTIRNIGDAALSLVSTPPVYLTGDNSSDFSIEVQPAVAVSGGASTTFTLQFAPTSGGSKTAWVVIPNSDSANDPYTFMVQGNAVQTSGEIDVLGNGIVIANGDTTPATADNSNFGIIETGETATHSFTIENNGVDALTLNGTPVVTITGSTLFSVVSQPSGTVIDPGGSRGFSIRFSPTSEATANATVTIASSDADRDPYTFAISGGSTDITPVAPGGGSGGSDGSAGGCNILLENKPNGWVPLFLLGVVLAALRFRPRSAERS